VATHSTHSTSSPWTPGASGPGSRSDSLPARSVSVTSTTRRSCQPAATTSGASAAGSKAPEPSRARAGARPALSVPLPGVAQHRPLGGDAAEQDRPLAPRVPGQRGARAPGRHGPGIDPRPLPVDPLVHDQRLALLAGVAPHEQHPAAVRVVPQARQGEPRRGLRVALLPVGPVPLPGVDEVLVTEAAPVQQHRAAHRVPGERGADTGQRAARRSPLPPAPPVPLPGVVSEVQVGADAAEQHHPVAGVVVGHRVPVPGRRRRRGLGLPPGRSLPAPGVGVQVLVPDAGVAGPAEHHDVAPPAVPRHGAVGTAPGEPRRWMEGAEGAHEQHPVSAVPLPGVPAQPRVLTALVAVDAAAEQQRPPPDGVVGHRGGGAARGYREGAPADPAGGAPLQRRVQRLPLERLSAEGHQPAARRVERRGEAAVCPRPERAGRRRPRDYAGAAPAGGPADPGEAVREGGVLRLAGADVELRPQAARRGRLEHPVGVGVVVPGPLAVEGGDPLHQPDGQPRDVAAARRERRRVARQVGERQVHDRLVRRAQLDGQLGVRLEAARAERRPVRVGRPRGAAGRHGLVVLPHGDDAGLGEGGDVHHQPRRGVVVVRGAPPGGSVPKRPAARQRVMWDTPQKPGDVPRSAHGHPGVEGLSFAPGVGSVRSVPQGSAGTERPGKMQTPAGVHRVAGPGPRR